MPHFKCVACKTRLYSAEGPGDLVDLIGELCPRCGSVLEPVGRLKEVVGFQTIIPAHDADDHGASARRQGMADGIRGPTAIDAQAQLDAERWFDDGGNVRAEALGLP